MTHQKKKTRIIEMILEHVNMNFKAYILVLIIFIIGIISGIILFNNLLYEQKQDIAQYINFTIDDLKENMQIDKILLLRNSILNNIFFCILMWFVGSTIIGLPIVYGIVVFKGFSLGYTISAIVAILGIGRGMIFAITSLFFHNMILIPCTLALAVSGTRFYKSIVRNRKRENIKYGVIKHTMFSLIICLLFIVSSFIEVYISAPMFEWGLKAF